MLKAIPSPSQRTQVGAKQYFMLPVFSLVEMEIFLLFFFKNENLRFQNKIQPH
jgi:hypothetical protein